MAEDMVSVETTNEIILLKELNHRVTALEAKFLSSQKLNTQQRRAPPSVLYLLYCPPDVDKKDALADNFNNNNVVNLPLLLILADRCSTGCHCCLMLFAKTV